MRQAGFKPATAPTTLVWIASQKVSRKLILSSHTHRPVQFIPLKWYNFLNNFDFAKRWNKAIFFDHCLPPRKHILGTKGIKLHTRRLSFFAYHVFVSNLHTHIWQQKRACHKLNWLSWTQRNTPVGITSIRGGFESRPTQTYLLHYTKKEHQGRSMLYNKKHQ